jgi:hypothetical protein
MHAVSRRVACFDTSAMAQAAPCDRVPTFCVSHSTSSMRAYICCKFIPCIAPMAAWYMELEI